MVFSHYRPSLLILQACFKWLHNRPFRYEREKEKSIFLGKFLTHKKHPHEKKREKNDKNFSSSMRCRFISMRWPWPAVSTTTTTGASTGTLCWPLRRKLARRHIHLSSISNIHRQASPTSTGTQHNGTTLHSRLSPFPQVSNIPTFPSTSCKFRLSVYQYTTSIISYSFL